MDIQTASELTRGINGTKVPAHQRLAFAGERRAIDAPPGLEGSRPLLEHTLVSLLVERARQPAAIAATHKQAGAWVDVTWQALRDDVRTVSDALVGLGVQPGDRVAVFAATSLRWLACDLAISAAQAITVAVYPSSTPAELAYILNDSEAVAIFVDHDDADGKQAGRLARCREAMRTCSRVRHVVAIERGATPGEISWSELSERASAPAAATSAAFERRVESIRTSDACSFIYTSGTSGSPKGVILTHGNWTFEARAIAELGHMLPDDTVLLFLPLAHAFAQATKATWLGLGYRMIVAESPEKLPANVLETHPSVLPAVPRVFEKIYEGVVAAGGTRDARGVLFRWAMREFERSLTQAGGFRPWRALSLRLAQALVFSKMRKMLSDRLGGNMRVFVSGGAPLSKKIAHFFDMLGLTVLEGYGLTETCAAVTINRPDAYRLGTVGQAMAGVELKLAGDGEILVRGGNVTQGYFRNPRATALALSPDGWFRTGDIGQLDSDGYLTIVDRKKDIIVTSVGKKIAPQLLEGRLENYSIISHAVIHGDRRKYLSALITIHEDAARKLVPASGGDRLSRRALIARLEVLAEVQRAIDEVNAGEAPYSRIQRFALVDGEFTQEGGELTPTLKVKRKVCAEKYKALLDSLYDDAPV